MNDLPTGAMTPTRAHAQPTARHGVGEPREAWILASVLTSPPSDWFCRSTGLPVLLSFRGARSSAASYPYQAIFAIPRPISESVFGFAFRWDAAILGTIPAEGWLAAPRQHFLGDCYDTEYAMVDRDDDLRIGIKDGCHHLSVDTMCLAVTVATGDLALLAGIGLHRA